MVYYKLRATEDIQVGHTKYESGDEFVLNQTDLAKWVSKSNFTKGSLIFVGEVSGDEPAYISKEVKTHRDSKAKQDGAITPLNFELITLPVIVSNIAATDIVVGEKWHAIAPCDCVFEGLEFNNLSQEEAGSRNHSFDISVSPRSGWKTGTASGSLLQEVGTYRNVQNVMVGNENGYVDATIPARGGDGSVPMNLLKNAGNYCYVGYHDKFGGVHSTVTVKNTEAALCAVQYPQIDENGNIEWTNLSPIADATVTAGKSLDKSGAITWDIPSDWAKTKMVGNTKDYFHVRIYNNSNIDMTNTTAVKPMSVTTNKITPYSSGNGVAQFINAGDKITINQTVAGVAGVLYNGSLYLRRVN